ncbi:MAG: helix-turn-helix domain-containing protein [Lentihominibacter sp.]
MNKLANIVDSHDRKLNKLMQSTEDSLVSFSMITDVPVTFFSSECEILWEVNHNKKVCLSNKEYNDPECSCFFNLRSAMKTAHQLGEVYIYVCNTGLTSMCYSLIYENDLIGYFNAGPILMGKNRAHTISQFYNNVSKELTDLPMLLTITDGMKMYTPQEVTYLARLFSDAFRSAFQQGNESVAISSVDEDTSAGAKIIEIKKDRIQMQYPLALEQNLIKAIKSGSCESSRKLFSEYLGELAVFEGGNLSVLKLRLLTLFAKLLNTTPDHDSIDHLETINSAAAFTELSKAAIRIVDLTARNYSSGDSYTGDSEIVAEAIEYIHNNFTKEINLNITAEAIHVNNTYLSTLFKKEMHVSIIDYINNLRLKRAAELLSGTNSSITEISLSCGFKGMSHFARLFSTKYKETPRQYRNSHRV